MSVGERSQNRETLEIRPLPRFHDSPLSEGQSPSAPTVLLTAAALPVTPLKGAFLLLQSKGWIQRSSPS